jgi:thiol-disulfide isomerase/thioredoxin
MNVKKYVRALLCLYLTLIIATDAVKGQSLKVGDTLPPELWSLPLDVINHPEGKDCITLSDYKDKLIILDFWATWCSPCIAMLPKQDSLQRQFKDQLQILPVTYQTGEEVSTFMEKYEKRKGIHIDLPKVINNQSLKPYFQHATIPHYIWIKAGVVKAITGMDEVKGEKITAILQEEKVAMKTKSQIPRMGYVARNGSLLEFLAHKKPELMSEFSYRSGLSGYIEGLSSGLSIAKPKEGVPYWRMTLTNVPLLRFYQFGYGEGATFTNLATIDIQSADSLHIMSPHGMKDFTEWINKNTYCYEFMVPESRSKEAFELFRNQLKTIFPKYTVVVEDRSVPVLALERTGEIPLKTSEATRYSTSFDRLTFKSVGGPPLYLVKRLNSMHLSHIGKPIVDMTDFTENIELLLEVNMSNVEELNTALRTQGLELRERIATVPILIIKDKI